MFTFSICNPLPTFCIFIDEEMRGEGVQKRGNAKKVCEYGNFAKTFRLIFAVVMTLTDTIKR